MWRCLSLITKIKTVLCRWCSVRDNTCFTDYLEKQIMLRIRSAQERNDWYSQYLSIPVTTTKWPNGTNGNVSKNIGWKYDNNAKLYTCSLKDNFGLK